MISKRREKELVWYLVDEEKLVIDHTLNCSKRAVAADKSVAIMYINSSSIYKIYRMNLF